MFSVTIETMTKCWTTVYDTAPPPPGSVPASHQHHFIGSLQPAVLIHIATYKTVFGVTISHAVHPVFMAKGGYIEHNHVVSMFDQRRR